MEAGSGCDGPVGWYAGLRNGLNPAGWTTRGPDERWTRHERPKVDPYFRPGKLPENRWRSHTIFSEKSLEKAEWHLKAPGDG